MYVITINEKSKLHWSTKGLANWIWNWQRNYTPLITKSCWRLTHTGADVNALNGKTFKKLFPDQELSNTSVILKNFDNTCVKPLGTFKCFLRWKGQQYRVDMEVMDSNETPNVLLREQTYIPKVLKQYFVLRKNHSKKFTDTFSTQRKPTWYSKNWGKCQNFHIFNYSHKFPSKIQKIRRHHTKKYLLKIFRHLHWTS